MKVLSLLLVVMIFLFGIMLSFFNPGTVSVDYMFGQQDLSLSLLLLGLFFIGFIAGVGSMGWMLWRSKHKVRQIKRKLGQVQKEVDNLRVVPITGGQ
jgi:uncharacterized membrane protein YciS (DUF1049 family)